MKKIAYFDCFAGISGDMILGALLDAGLDLKELKSHLKELPVTGWEITAEKVTRKGIAGTLAHVTTEETKRHRHLPEIEEIIGNSGLSDTVKNRALSIFGSLADAEAAVHGVPRASIHFHEVGALDAIIDITGACIGFELLGFDEILASPVNTGGGFIECAHGTLPVPAPATSRLLEGMTIYNSGIETELVTPTGAAIIKTTAGSSSTMPALTLDTTGFGAGTREHPLPNLLRIFIGTLADQPSLREEVVLLETGIDDTTPEVLGYLFTRLFNAGALDVFISPALMKKNRPGHTLSVLVSPGKEKETVEAIFKETSTSGIRRSSRERYILPRRSLSVSTPYGTIRIKEHFLNEEVITASPEFEDCKKCAEKTGLSLQKIYTEALFAYQKGSP